MPEIYQQLKNDQDKDKRNLGIANSLKLGRVRRVERSEVKAQNKSLKSSENLIVKEKVIGFSSDLIPSIINGSKTLTYRMGTGYNSWKVGEKAIVRDSGSKEVVGSIEVLGLWHTPFSELPINAKGHEEYESKDVQREILQTYSKNPIKDDSPITVIHFRFSKAEL